MPTSIVASPPQECPLKQDIPGADRIAKRTGATIIGNGETIHVMRRAGVPENQLLPVAGTERVILGEGVTVTIFPSLHALIPADFGGPHASDFFDVAMDQRGGLDVQPGGPADMHVGKIPPFMGMMFDKVRNAPKEVVESDADLKAFQTYLLDPNEHYSYFDGGQLMYAIDIAGHGRLLYSSHTGCYSSILKEMQPKPDVVILGVPARPNLDGYPYQGTNAQFLLEEVQWLKPKKVPISIARSSLEVVFCLKDAHPGKPYWAKTEAAETLIHEKTDARVINMEWEKPISIFEA